MAIVNPKERSMRRFHIALAVADLTQSIADYSAGLARALGAEARRDSQARPRHDSLALSCETGIEIDGGIREGEQRGVAGDPAAAIAVHDPLKVVVGAAVFAAPPEQGQMAG